MPRAGVDYPGTFGQFQSWFGTYRDPFDEAFRLAGFVVVPD
jgi:hypothetical protein